MRNFLSKDVHNGWHEVFETEGGIALRAESPTKRIPVELIAPFHFGKVDWICLQVPSAKRPTLVATLGMRTDTVSVLQIQDTPEEYMQKDLLELHLHLGQIALSLEEYSDLCPGMELHFDRPASWQVSVMLGSLTVARGHLKIEDGVCALHVDSLVSSDIDGKLLQEFAESCRDKETSL